MFASNRYKDQPIQKITYFMDNCQVSPVDMKKVKYYNRIHIIRIEVPIKQITLTSK